MTLLRPLAPLLGALALAACADGPPLSPSAADLNPGSDPGLETIAPGSEGLYEGDPLAGPNLDPTNDLF
jgi:hypothetical protein